MIQTKRQQTCSVFYFSSKVGTVRIERIIGSATKCSLHAKFSLAEPMLLGGTC